MGGFITIADFDVLAKISFFSRSWNSVKLCFVADLLGRFGET